MKKIYFFNIERCNSQNTEQKSIFEDFIKIIFIEIMHSIVCGNVFHLVLPEGK